MPEILSYLDWLQNSWLWFRLQLQVNLVTPNLAPTPVVHKGQKQSRVWLRLWSQNRPSLVGQGGLYVHSGKQLKFVLKTKNWPNKIKQFMFSIFLAYFNVKLLHSLATKLLLQSNTLNASWSSFGLLLPPHATSALQMHYSSFWRLFGVQCNFSVRITSNIICNMSCC